MLYSIRNQLIEINTIGPFFSFFENIKICAGYLSFFFLHMRTEGLVKVKKNALFFIRMLNSEVDENVMKDQKKKIEKMHNPYKKRNI